MASFHLSWNPVIFAYQPVSPWESMPMSLRAYAHNAHIKTQTGVDLDRGGLDNTPVSASGRDLLRAHLGREVLHGSVGRDLFKSYMRNADGTKLPRMYRFDTEALGRCEYVMLTNEQYAVVLVVDVDQIGTADVDPADLNPYVRDVVCSLIAHNIGPSWGGINPTNGKAQFFSGRDLINVVKTRREEAQAFKALAQDVDAEIADGLDQYDPELIDGVSVLWITQVKAARDETAFRHALKTGHRLRQQGQRLTDAAIIDACEHAYNVAHAHCGDGRDSEMPPMRDRQTMARRVHGYVTQSKSEAYTYRKSH
ncbi:replication initiation protein [Corynebacterium pseudodiphtheriticum]|uniref:replication initiation protein n=1 Tax=Corynebacterium pseudodiphtheriticum TaxID=37637 RepID=UPI00254084D1|nr:replication initiation protein [Corynebacterium pseudodiphtheriticum]MDK4237223.1 replication initiation protein [Corynebacterium pseudodiphtheriticum]MDK4286569.1 replication initiation protein [Corynebacterium pseudodiphtheriticum]MDK4315918.1 replication initiation protein [Corynebacterium pseudodiphtheriticum]